MVCVYKSTIMVELTCKTVKRELVMIDGEKGVLRPDHVLTVTNLSS